MKIGLVIPWRETPSRIKPLQSVLEWYQTNLSDIEIFYADRPGEKWNGAASRNDGVKKAQEAHCDVIIVNDADTIPEIKPLLEAIEHCQKDGMVHNPYTLCKYIENEMCEYYYNGTDIKLLKHRLYTEANGGIWVCTPETWWSIGGMDERFIQWGGEDMAFEMAHKVIKGNKLIKHDGYIYCLSHMQQFHDEGYHSSYVFNTELFLRYRSALTLKEMLLLINQNTKND